MPRKFVFGVGLYTIGYNLYDQFSAPIMHNTQDPPNLSKYGKGSYAVVTGASNSTG